MEFSFSIAILSVRPLILHIYSVTHSFSRVTKYKINSWTVRFWEQSVQKCEFNEWTNKPDGKPMACGSQRTEKTYFTYFPYFKFNPQGQEY